MPDPTEYKTTDQILIFSLLLAGAKPSKIQTDERHQCMYAFDPKAVFLNNQKEWTVEKAIELILKADTSCFTFTLPDYWAAQNTWLMSLRNKNVQSV